MTATATCWWILGADGLGLAVLGLVLADLFIPRSAGRPGRWVRNAAPARPASVPAHCPSRGRRSVARTLDRRVPRTGGPGRHSPGEVSGTETQRRLSETMEFAAVPA